MDQADDPTRHLSPDELLFVNSAECPFAQRVLIGLKEKGLRYKQVEINLRGPDGKPSLPICVKSRGPYYNWELFPLLRICPACFRSVRTRQ